MSVLSGCYDEILEFPTTTLCLVINVEIPKNGGCCGMICGVLFKFVMYYVIRYRKYISRIYITFPSDGFWYTSVWREGLPCGRECVLSRQEHWMYTYKARVVVSTDSKAEKASKNLRLLPGYCYLIFPFWFAFFLNIPTFDLSWISRKELQLTFLKTLRYCMR